MTSEQEKLVKQVFKAAYFDEYKTYDGWKEAYDWWIDPRQECLIEKAAKSGAGRCHRKCQTCTSILVNRTNVQKG